MSFQSVGTDRGRFWDQPVLCIFHPEGHVSQQVGTIDVEVRKRCVWLWWSLAWVCRRLWCWSYIGVGDRRITPWWGRLWRLKDWGDQPDLDWWKICYYQNRRKLPAGYGELWPWPCTRENLRMWMLVCAGVVLPSTPRDLVFRQVGSITIVSQLYLHILLLCLVVPFPTVFLHVVVKIPGHKRKRVETHRNSGPRECAPRGNQMKGQPSS